MIDISIILFPIFCTMTNPAVTPENTATASSPFVLSVLELKVLDALGLKKEQIFKPQKYDAKETKLATIYINPKGYIKGTTDRMLIIITPDNNSLESETGTALVYRKVATGEVNDEGTRVDDELIVVTFEQGKQLVSKLCKSVTQSMGEQF